MNSDSGQLSREFLDAAVDLMGRAGRGGTLRVRGRSMTPTLVEGQTVAVEFSPATLRRGDILVFRQDGSLVVHRLLGAARFPDGRDGLRTRGDGAPTLDPHLHESQVLGRVIALRMGDVWRTTRSARARAYARLLAWHDFFWAASGVLARGTEKILAALRIRLPLQQWVAAADRRLLNLAHGSLFRWAHDRVAAPAEAGENVGRDDSGIEPR